jgi:hypothetical protein
VERKENKKVRMVRGKRKGGKGGTVGMGGGGVAIGGLFVSVWVVIPDQ